ncbi:MAG: PAS domain S-box protein [Fimbriimonas sp.]
MQTLSSPDGVISIDSASRRILRASPIAASILRSSPDALQGKELWEVGLWPDAAAANDAIDEVLDRRFGRLDEWEVRDERGTIAQVELICTVACDSERPVVQCHIRDLTHRKQAEQEARRVLDSAHCLLWQAEVEWREGRPFWSPEIRNPVAAQRFLRLEVPTGSTLWRSFIEAKDPEELEIQRALTEMALKTGQSGYQQEFRIRTAAGDIWLYEDVRIEVCGDGRWNLTGICTDVTERKRAEEAARNSELHKADVLAAALDCVVTMDAHGFITGFNSAAETTFDYRRQDAVGKSLADLIVPPRLRDRHREGLARYLATGESAMLNRRIEAEAIRADGTEFPVELTVIATPTGEDVAFTSFVRDITERKRTEQALRESHERLELVSKATNDAVWDWNLTADVHWNSGFSTLFGYSLDEIQPGIESWTERIHPDDLQRVNDSIWAVIEGTSECWQAEYRFLRKDGSFAHVFDRGQCIRDEFGKATRMIGAMIDITERKQAEEALHESIAGYRSMFTANPHPMWVYDAQTLAFLSVNEAAIAHYGYTEAEFLAMTIRDIRPEEEVDRMLAVKSDPLASDRKEGTWRHRKKNGEIIHVEVASHSSIWEGVPARVVLVNDVTERKEVEERLLSAHAELESRVHHRTAEVRRANVALKNEIGERRQAEEELRLSEARYRAIVEDQTEMICRFQSDGTLTFVNEAHCRYFQQASQDILGTSILDFLSAEDAEAARQRFATLGPTNPVASYEIQSASRNGEVRWQHWTDRYLVDEKGAFVSFQSVGRDITERKIVEIELQRSKEELERANEELTRNEARLLNGNSIFTELTRLHVTSEEELQAALTHITEAGSELLDVDRCSIWLYDGHHSKIRCADLFERNLERHSSGLELTVLQYPNYFSHLLTRRSIVAHDAHHHAATYEFSEAYLTPLGIASMLDVPIIIGGRMVGVLCCEQVGEPRRWLVEDQTFASSAASICSVAIESLERARAEEALREARDEAESARREAEAANRAKSEFLSRMSHELRTPLNAILGFGQILEAQGLTPMQHESVGYVLKGGRHLLELINEVLDISRVEAGHLDLSIEPVDVVELLPETCALLRPLADAREIGLELQVAGLGMHILADRQRLRQVVFNLLSNAIKYNRHGGRVEISGQVISGDRMRLAVRDTGPGIEERDLRKLFTPFERLGATSSEIEGTGLGLAVSQRLVAAMGGSLSVESVLGEGSVFFIDFPLAQCPVERAQGSCLDMAQGEGGLSSKGKWSVLCIEDNTSNLRLLEVFFASRPEIALTTAQDGRTGLAMARDEEPNLILLDLHLPELSGPEVLESLKRSALTRDIPVVIVSADATPAQVERLLADGAHAYLTKPLDLAAFSRTLDEVLLLE